MSCKGLVELIVLNIGLQAKILSTRVFTMFVVMALVTTFATTPLASALYPGWYQVSARTTILLATLANSCTHCCTEEARGLETWRDRLDFW
jgi:Kef-type K+ transport system membrane component KefB